MSIFIINNASYLEIMGFNIFNQNLDWRRNYEINSGEPFWVKEHLEEKGAFEMCV